MPTEDFTTYTEADPNNHLSETSSRVTAAALIRNESAYVYKDFGADHFDDFTHDFDMRCTAYSGDGAFFMTHSVSNALADFLESGDGVGERVIGVSYYYDITSTQLRIYLWQYRAAVMTSDFYGPASLNVTYFIRMKKTGTSLVAGIYSTAALRNAGNGTDGDLDNLAITISDDTYRYCYGGQSVTSSWNPNSSMDAYVENLDLQEAAVAAKQIQMDGFYYIEN